MTRTALTFGPEGSLDMERSTCVVVVKLGSVAVSVWVSNELKMKARSPAATAVKAMAGNGKRRLNGLIHTLRYLRTSSSVRLGMDPVSRIWPRSMRAK